MPTFGLPWTKPDLELYKRRAAWRDYYLAKGVSTMRVSDLAQKKAKTGAYPT